MTIVIAPPPTVSSCRGQYSPMGIALTWATDQTRDPSGLVKLFKNRLKSIRKLLVHDIKRLRTLITSLGEDTSGIKGDEEVQQRHFHRSFNGLNSELFVVRPSEPLGPLHGNFDMARLEPERPWAVALAAMLEVPMDSLWHGWEIRDEPETCDGVYHGDHSIDDLQST